MTARLAMVADSVASVRRESRVWVKNLIGEGHATVRRNRRAVEEELMVEPLRGACACAEKGEAAMKRATCLIGVIIAAYLMTTPAGAGGTQGVRALDAPAAVKVRIADGYGKLPLSFEANQGQTDGQVKFLSRGSGYTLFLTSTGAVLALSKPEGKPSAEQPTSTSGTVVRMKLIGANSASRITGLQERPGKVNYFIGNDPSKWRTNVPIYARVRYERVYPGVDLAYYGNQRQLEYDFVVAPGADPGAIKLAFEGARDIESDASGNLIVRTAGGDLRMHKPVIYQEVGGVKQMIPGWYVLANKRNVGFHVAAYDRSKPLVIDPVLAYSTYLGGGAVSAGAGIAVDATGHAYVTGSSTSLAFPTTAGAFQTACTPPPARPTRCSGDAFVTKLDPSGSALVYSTYLGDDGADSGAAVAVDSAGHAYVTGETRSANFPTKVGAFQIGPGGNGDAFVTKLGPAGSDLVYSTYLGGSSDDAGNGIAIDSAGHVYVTGRTRSSHNAIKPFPTTPGTFQTAFGGLSDAFVTKLDSAGSTLVYSTYLGGGSPDTGFGIATDAAGHAYVTGQTSSDNFPTTAGAFQTARAGLGDAFVTKLDPAGAVLVYSTYLGGSGSDAVTGTRIAVDAADHAYVTGQTSSADFPTTAGAFQSASGGLSDAFVTKLDPTGSDLVYSTYLGGSGDDQSAGIAVDSTGNAYVSGTTSTNDFPTTAGAFQPASGGGFDAFVTKLNAAGSAQVYSTYLGGSRVDIGAGIALDAAGNAYVTGSTTSNDFPTTAGAFDEAFNLGQDVFVTKIPTATIEGLIAELGTLDLSGGEENSLTGKLQAAERSLARGNPTPAINQLNAFINEVRALERSGRLDAATADALIAQTQAIIGQL